MIKELRLSGESEDSIREFAAKYTGDPWEEFFEGLFGYESLLEAREKYGENDEGKPRRQYATWREPISEWLSRIERREKEAGERNRLRSLEADRLKAAGVSESEASAQAEIEASRIIKADQLLKVPEPKARAVKKEKKRTPTRRRKERVIRGGRSTPFFDLGQWIRFSIGGAICAIYGANDFLGVNVVPESLGLRHLDNLNGLIAGAFLIVSAFSSQSFFASLVLGGAVLVIGMEPISAAVNQTVFTASFCMGVGILMMLVGLAVPALSRLTGQKF